MTSRKWLWPCVFTQLKSIGQLWYKVQWAIATFCELFKWEVTSQKNMRVVEVHNLPSWHNISKIKISIFITCLCLNSLQKYSQTIACEYYIIYIVRLKCFSWYFANYCSCCYWVGEQECICCLSKSWNFSGARCKIPRLLNGNLICSVVQSAFTCSIECNPGYYVSGRTVVGELTCTDTQWDKNITDDFERLTCFSKKQF